ncbi:2'-5' RNA ligase family protein [Aeromicrobium sp. CF3.5]|uniref:2'-5' RNA ligase family protein n=1 Tax=Aeromicrobium sp. CF3.5 TaxID=3373078 RepID=UPI003EE52759
MRRTIGVAVPVPEPFGSLLREARASFGDALAATIPTHITLMPPIDLEEDLLQQLPEILDDVAARVPAYRVILRGTDTFRPVSPVVFVAVVDGVEPTQQLAQKVRTATGCEELEFPYHPHITVAHHLDDAALDHAETALAAFECEFVATEFALYHQDERRGWEPQRTFALPID